MNSSNTKADLNGQGVSQFPNKELSMTAFAATINTTGDAGNIAGLLAEKIAAANYWERRCKAAEAYIREVPCDPDITAAQIKAHEEWKNISNQIINDEKP
jgi:hypothetical protein